MCIRDSRINLTLYQLGEVLKGNLDAIIEPLIREQTLLGLNALMAEA